METANRTWETVVEEDPVTGELILTLPPELIKIQNWKEGDELEWIDNGDGSWFLSKVDTSINPTDRVR
jgi:hypothetical protein